MIDFIDGILEPALWFLADWSLRWGLLIGVLAFWLFTVRPRRSATRYLLCLLVLLAGLVLPVLPRWGTGFAIAPANPPLLASAPAESVELSESRGHVSFSEQKVESPNVAAAAPNPASPRQPARPTQLQQAEESLGFRRLTIFGLAMTWVLGAGLLFARWLGGWLLLERLRRTAMRVDGTPAQVFQACRTRLAVRRQATLASHPAVHSPFTLGLYRPTILVPPSWKELPEQVQRGSLLHECAHLARFDDWLAVLFELIRVFFFFHPLLYWLLGRLEYERELLCDETALAGGIDPRDYAGTLLEFSRQAGRLRPALISPSYPLRFGHRRTVKARIHRLLEANMNRWMSPLPVGRAFALATLVLGLALALGSFGAGAIEPDDKESPTPAAAARADPQQSSTATKTAANEPVAADKVKKASLTYGGKSFAVWREVLASDLKPEVRIEAIKALSAFGTNGYGAEAASAIIEAMRGYDIALNDPEDSKVFGAAPTPLNKIGQPAVLALVEELKHGPVNGRRFAIMALMQMESRAASAAPAVIEAFKSDDLYVRQNALLGIQRINPDPKLLIPALPALSAMLKDADRNLRFLAVSELARMGPNAKPAVPVLLAMLQNDKENDAESRYSALGALQAIGPRAKEVLPALLMAMKDENYTLREAVWRYVEALGPEAKEAVPELIRGFKNAEQNPSERIAIARALGSMGPAAKDAVPTLLDFVPQSGPKAQDAVAVQEALRKISR